MPAALSKLAAACCFAIVLLSYSAQSELAQLVQRTYHKPVFLLYLTHSGYMWIAPLHLLACRLYRVDLRNLADRLHVAVSEHCSTQASNTAWATGESEVTAKRLDLQTRTPWRELGPAYFRMILFITVSITVPALSWYCAVPLTSMTDITALYNSNAFVAYLLAIYLVRTEKLEWRKGCAVVLACVGVVVITYGDAQAAPDPAQHVNLGSRLLGSLLALFGSITYAFYEVYYSRFIALGEIPLAVAVPARRISGQCRRSSGRPLMASPRNARGDGYTGLPTDEEDDRRETIEVVTRSPTSPTMKTSSPKPTGSDQAVYLAYANLVTASIGLCTMCLLWIPLAILHFTGLEEFGLPPDGKTCMAIAGVVACGVTYNAGFMILLGEFGPIVASVGNLCTLVLVAAADVLLVGAELTLSTLLGSALIVGAFSVLAVDALG